MALRAALGAGRGRLVRSCSPSRCCSPRLAARSASDSRSSRRACCSRSIPTHCRVVQRRHRSRRAAVQLALSLGTGMLFGLVPALDAARDRPRQSLRDGGRGASGGRGGKRVRRALVVAQVGLAVMLLVGAGLLVRSFGELTRVRLGFDPSHVLTAQLRATGERYDSNCRRQHFFDARARRRAQRAGRDRGRRSIRAANAGEDRRDAARRGRADRREHFPTSATSSCAATTSRRWRSR